MNEYKTFEELKEELGNNYDLFMYEINLCLLKKIEKAIKFIEEYYYSTNTMNIDCIGYTTDKMLKVRNILKGESNE